MAKYNPDKNYVQPSAPELEDVVLGAMLLNPYTVEVQAFGGGAPYIEKSAIEEVISFLVPDAFYNPINKIIYEGILEMYEKKMHIDILTFSQFLAGKKQLQTIGGAYYVTTLTNRIVSGANVQYHARIVTQKYLQREIIRITAELNSQAHEEGVDALDLLFKVKKELTELEERLTQDRSVSTTSIFDKTLENIKSVKDGKAGLQCHIVKLNQLIGGFRPGYYSIGARPSIGKSGLAKSLIISMIKQKIKCKIFSLEVTAEIFLIGVLAEWCEIDNQKILNNTLTAEELMKIESARFEICKYLFIDDNPKPTAAYFKTQMKKAVELGVEFFCVDYIQLATFTKAEAMEFRSREEKVAYISRELKITGIELKIPLLVLFQLNRDSEKRDKDDFKPKLSDARESGAIEQDSDVAILIHRPSHHGVKSDANGNSYAGKAFLMIEKNKFGPRQTIVTDYIANITKFDNKDCGIVIPTLEQQTQIPDDTEDPF